MTEYYIRRKKKEFMTITPQQGGFFVTRVASDTFAAGEIETPMMGSIYKKLRRDKFEKMVKEEDFALYYLMGGYEIN